MKKTLPFMLAAAALMLAACTLRSTSRTSFSVSKTTDGGTKEYTYTTEFTAENGKGLNTDVKDETPDDADEYVNYTVSNGLIHINAPSGDEAWWEIVGDTNTIDLDGWTVQNNVYYGTGKSLIKDGTAYVLVGRYLKDDEKHPERYVIFEVQIEDSKITQVTDSAVVNSLDEYFKN